MQKTDSITIDFQCVLDYAKEMSEPDLSRPIRVYQTSALKDKNVSNILDDVARDFIEDPRNADFIITPDVGTGSCIII